MSFGSIHTASTMEARTSVARTMRDVRSIGRRMGSEGARELGNVIEDDMRQVVSGEAGYAPRPTAPFMELKIAVHESVHDTALKNSALSSLEGMEKRLAAGFKVQYPGLKDVDLGMDDLLDMAAQGRKLAVSRLMASKQTLGNARGSFIDKVRSRIGAVKADGLRADSLDFDPREHGASETALATIAVAVLKERRTQGIVPLDPAERVTPKSIRPNSVKLMEFAAERSASLSGADEIWLRDEIVRSGRAIQTATDREADRKEAESYGFGF